MWCIMNISVRRNVFIETKTSPSGSVHFTDWLVARRKSAYWLFFQYSIGTLWSNSSWRSQSICLILRPTPGNSSTSSISIDVCFSLTKLFRWRDRRSMVRHRSLPLDNGRNENWKIQFRRNRRISWWCRTIETTRWNCVFDFTNIVGAQANKSFTVQQPTWGPTHLEFYHFHNFCCFFKHLVAAPKVNNWKWKYFFSFESNRNWSRKKTMRAKRGENERERLLQNSNGQCAFRWCDCVWDFRHDIFSSMSLSYSSLVFVACCFSLFLGVAGRRHRSRSCVPITLKIGQAKYH